MVIAVVIGLNVVLALLGFYVAWRLWCLQRTLSNVADTVLEWERNTHRTLDPAVTPGNIYQGQQGVAQLRQRYARLLEQLHQLQRLLSVVLIGWRVVRSKRWRRRSRRLY